MPTPIYHITDINNLPRIIRTGGLWCDAERVRQDFPCVGIAHVNLKRRRARTPVRARTGQSVAVGGTLADYVPFYFANRSPMLFSIHCGQVAGYAGSQRDIVYLVSTVERVESGDRSWCFTDGHAVEAVTEFHANAERLDEVDWDLIRDWSWRNTEADPDRKRRKQAEFLVHSSVPWDWFHRIAVMDRPRLQHVREILAGMEHQPEVAVERRWYYD